MRGHITVDHPNFHCDIFGYHVGHNICNGVADQQPDDVAVLQCNNITNFVGDLNAEYHCHKHCHNRHIHRLKHRVIVGNFNRLFNRDKLTDIFRNDFSDIIRNDVAIVVRDHVGDILTNVFCVDFPVVVCHFERVNNCFVVGHDIANVDCNNSAVWKDPM